MEQFFGWMGTMSLAMGGLLLFRYLSNSTAAENSGSSFVQPPGLKIKEFDDFRGESRSFLFENGNILENFVKSYNRIRFQPGLNIMADRDYNGLNQIRYNIDKYDVINGIH
jgi:hypothetical protein